jgi:hypothetical protein
VESVDLNITQLKASVVKEMKKTNEQQTGRQRLRETERENGKDMK